MGPAPAPAGSNRQNFCHEPCSALGMPCQECGGWGPNESMGSYGFARCHKDNCGGSNDPPGPATDSNFGFWYNKNLKPKKVEVEIMI